MSTNFQSWAVDTLIRAVKTAAQTAVAALGVNATGLLHVDWVSVGSLAGLAAVTCVLQNLSNLSVPDAAVVPVVESPLHAGDVPAAPVVESAPTDPAAPAPSILGKA